MISPMWSDGTKTDFQSICRNVLMDLFPCGIGAVCPPKPPHLPDPPLPPHTRPPGERRETEKEEISCFFQPPLSRRAGVRRERGGRGSEVPEAAERPRSWTTL